VPDGYSTAGPHLMGINAASEGQLRAMARFAGVDQLYAFAETAAAGRAFATAVATYNPALKTEWVPTSKPEDLSALGTLMLPGPGLSAYAWMRRALDPRSFSLCGITHTTATPVAMDALTELWTAPIEPWDALICTSHAVKSMVTGLLEAQREYLSERLGACRGALPQLPVIPLGVDSDAYQGDPSLRRRWRDRLQIREAEVVLLFVGRLSPWGKSHPVPLFLAAGMAARRSAAPLRLILAGWFAQDGLEDEYARAAAIICPDLPITFLDGREPAVRTEIWQCADVFVSPVDNIQETFGLTPLEAMAAGLPVIASDWDGYRDTVRHEIDGLLAPTSMPPGGAGLGLARAFTGRAFGPEQFLGLTSQAVAVDVDRLAEAIARLADDPELRRTMGENGRRRARNDFDWRLIIGRYQTLWTELATMRQVAAKRDETSRVYPSRPDPYHAFRAYPQSQLASANRVRPGFTDPSMVAILFNSPLIAFAQPALPPLGEVQAMLEIAEVGDATIGDLVSPFGVEDTAARWRAVGWLLKYGFLRLGP
jgi:glycosyltransferase involved in cell wall biosynthesis